MSGGQVSFIVGGDSRVSSRNKEISVVLKGVGSGGRMVVGAGKARPSIAELGNVLLWK